VELAYDASFARRVMCTLLSSFLGHASYGLLYPWPLVILANNFSNTPIMTKDDNILSTFGAPFNPYHHFLSELLPWQKEHGHILCCNEPRND
jgi:hypothetical protein